MSVIRFKDIEDGTLFGPHYYRSATFIAVVLMSFIPILTLFSLAIHVSDTDHLLFLSTRLILLGLLLVAIAADVILFIWLSRMRSLFRSLQSIDVISIVRKSAEDFVRLFALCLISIFLAVMFAERLLGLF